MSGERKRAEERDAYRVFRRIPTRWMDNDVYGHINNVIFYSFFDTAVNQYLIEAGALDAQTSNTIGLVVETGCTYFSSVQFPQAIETGIRVAHIGKSSVRYEVGIFREDQPLSSATGYFVHVYVDRISRKPVNLPADLLSAISDIQAT